MVVLIVCSEHALVPHEVNVKFDTLLGLFNDILLLLDFVLVEKQLRLGKFFLVQISPNLCAVTELGFDG